MSEAEVLCELKGHLGLITLNRPKALNSLTAGMCEIIHTQLKAWEADARVRSIAVVGAGDKAFCAGGDVVQVVKAAKEGGDYHHRFFSSEYRMNVAIDECSKPFVALVDGITMGGGVGVSIPGDFWVATEKTLFAMPETGIGLFPDVGGGWFLPRLPGEVGMYLALTGARLKADDLFAIGIASHVTSSDKIPAIIEALAADETGSMDSVGDILDAHNHQPGSAPLADYFDRIDDLFNADQVETILSYLAQSDDPWAAKQLDILSHMSPTALKLTHAQLRRGGAMTNFRDNMQMEYRLVLRCAEGHDFPEGVRALLLDKDKSPKWSPARVEDVSADSIEAYFAPLASGDLDLDKLPN